MNKISNEIKQEIMNLVKTAKITYLSSVDGEGFPNTKAMLFLQHDGLYTHYFSTNLSARRTSQFINNSKCCLYFCDENEFKGLMLVGDIAVYTDMEHKTMLWRNGFEMYYPKGIDDNDFCVLKFTAKRGNYYHGLNNCDFNEGDI